MKRSRAFFLLPFLMVIIILTGCSTPAPLSETLIFRPYEVKSDTNKTYHGEIALFPAYFFYKSSVLDFARRKYAGPMIKKDSDVSLSYWNFEKKGLGITDTFIEDDDLAFGFTIGYAVLGFDFTARIKDPYYVTGQVSAYGGGQLIVQRPVLKRRKGGITIGPYYRYDAFFIEHGFGFSAIEFKRFRINSFGLRSSLQFRDKDSMIYGYIQSGYSPELKRLLVYAGLTLPVSKIR